MNDNNTGIPKKMKHLWMVEDYPAKGERPPGSYWTKIGVAFENRDGSWSLDIKAMPINGRLQMRDPVPPKDDALPSSRQVEARA